MIAAEGWTNRSRQSHFVHNGPHTMWRSIHVLRWLCLIEGMSLLILVGIAVPLKHFADQPMAVRVVGPIHGVLWIALCVNLATIAWHHRWSWLRTSAVFISSLVPAGFAAIDARLRLWANSNGKAS